MIPLIDHDSRARSQWGRDEIYPDYIVTSRQMTITGWWLTYPSEKYEFVSWDDDIPNMMGKIIWKPPLGREQTCSKRNSEYRRGLPPCTVSPGSSSKLPRFSWRENLSKLFKCSMYFEWLELISNVIQLFRFSNVLTFICHVELISNVLIFNVIHQCSWLTT